MRYCVGKLTEGKNTLRIKMPKLVPARQFAHRVDLVFPISDNLLLTTDFTGTNSAVVLFEPPTS
jgi:hypothetical protein